MLYIYIYIQKATCIFTAASLTATWKRLVCSVEMVTLIIIIIIIIIIITIFIIIIIIISVTLIAVMAKRVVVNRVIHTNTCCSWTFRDGSRTVV